MESKETGVILNCEKHGEYPEKSMTLGSREIKFNHCPACSKEAEQQREADERKRIEEANAKRNHDRRIHAGVSPRNMNMRFKNYRRDTAEQEHVYQKCNDYAKRIYDGEQVPNMIITGTVGTGKTMIATCIINAICLSKHVRIIKLADLLRRFKDTYSKDSERSESDVINYYTKLDLLIIDEVAANRKESDNDSALIFDVIDGRYERMLPTVIISNKDKENVTEILGARCIDRLREGGGILLGCKWESYRK